MDGFTDGYLLMFLTKGIYKTAKIRSAGTKGKEGNKRRNGKKEKA